MTKYMIAGLAMLALLAPATARAEPFTPELEADYAAALAYWEVPSPRQCASVKRELLPQDLGEKDGVEGAARATKPRPWERNVKCTLIVYANYLEPRCMEEVVIRHEVGHMLGLAHSPDPENIMYYQPPWSWCPDTEAPPVMAPHPPLPKLAPPRRARPAY